VIYPFINRFLHWFSTGLMIPVLVLMLLSKGVPLQQAGFVLACMSVVMVTMELPSGILSDLLGRKKIYLLSISISLLAVSLLLFSSGLLFMCAAFAAHGLARALSSGSIESSFIDAWIRKQGKEKLHSLVTVMNIGEAAGLASGAVLGGLLPDLWLRLRPESNQFSGNFLAQLSILAILLASTLPYKDQAASEKPLTLRRLATESAVVIKSSPILKILLLAGLLWGFTFNAIELYWQPRLQTLLPPDNSGLWFFGVINSGFFLTAIVGSLLMNLLLSKLKINNVLAAAILRMCLAGTLWLLAMQNGVAAFSTLYLMLMLCNGMLNIPEASLFNSIVPSAQRASFLSLSSLLVQLGGIAGALVFSLLLPLLGITGVWRLAAAVMLLSAGALLLLSGRKVQTVQSTTAGLADGPAGMPASTVLDKPSQGKL